MKLHRFWYFVTAAIILLAITLPHPVVAVQTWELTQVVEPGGIWEFHFIGGCTQHFNGDLYIRNGDEATKIKNIIVRPDGKYDTVLPSGEWMFVVPYGTGSAGKDNLHPERVNFTIINSETTHTWLIGNSATCGISEPQPPVCIWHEGWWEQPPPEWIGGHMFCYRCHCVWVPGHWATPEPIWHPGYWEGEDCVE